MSPSELSCQDSTEQLLELEAQDQELSEHQEEEEVGIPIPSETDRTRLVKAVESITANFPPACRISNY